MTTEKIGKSAKWRRLYYATKMENNSAKLSHLVDDAINAVLDQIERVRIQRELDELNEALNVLRSRRREASQPKISRPGNPHPTKAA
jgi:hypothetical protein